MHHTPTTSTVRFQKWSFVIDTSRFPGDFNREMTAYCTGMYGDCMIGVEMARLFYKEMNIGYGDHPAQSDRMEFSPYIKYIEQRADDRGVRRPCSIVVTPGYWTKGGEPAVKMDKATDEFKYPAMYSVAIHFESRPEDDEEWKKLLKIIMDRAILYSKALPIERVKVKPFAIFGFRLLAEETVITEVDNWQGDFDGEG